MADRDLNIEELLGKHQPRQHHYEFGHYVLRSVAFGDPKLARECLDREDIVARLWVLWQEVGRRLPEAERLSPTGLFVNRFRLGERCRLYVVTLPVPQQTSEAHLVGIVFTDKGDGEAAPEVRYFTLEKGFSMPGEPERTTLAEWHLSDDDLSHLNYGDGPMPALMDFARVIAGRLGESPEAVYHEPI